MRKSKLLYTLYYNPLWLSKFGVYLAVKN